MPENSFYATGRRKAAVARVWIFPGQKGFTINGRDPFRYLQRQTLQTLVELPLSAREICPRCIGDVALLASFFKVTDRGVVRCVVPSSSGV